MAAAVAATVVAVVAEVAEELAAQTSNAPLPQMHAISLVPAVVVLGLVCSALPLAPLRPQLRTARLVVMAKSATLVSVKTIEPQLKLQPARSQLGH